MNKYTELSDFEINKAVFIKLYGEESLKDKDMFNSFYRTDYCHNLEDAMPIIIENLISLMADMSDDGGSAWWCASDISNGITSRYKSNPYRAAMEVFLMIKDAENES
ncbi:phage protein NinX family protein [Proteus sp. G2660]|uniref:phage protein NinX family protein n=1 Tax=Proteus sp. G2660 TaxID=2698873 RepID=UPI001377DBA2|nr:DUF2591 domain-containing protein [Proteus sp. G2660]